jgi:hypothetical protein
MRRLSLLGGLFVLAAAGACAGPPVYRPPPGGSQVLTGPRHDEDATARSEAAGPTLAVVTLEDARPQHHRLALSSWLEEYDGYTGEAMTRDRAYRGAVDEMASDALADALRATGRFAEVRRVSQADRADADLVLDGRLRRLRGWQAYRVEKDAPARILESIGDVFIDEVVIIEAKTGRIVFIGQTGAMLEEPPDDVDPYAAAQAAFEAAAVHLAERVAKVDFEAADLSHEVHLEATRSGGVEALLVSLPPGWIGAEDPATVPAGWAADTPCAAYRFEDATRWFFHPRLGFYRPNLALWACPPGWQGEMRLGGDDPERFPASVVGFDADGGAWIALTLGKTSWPGATQQVVRFLSLRAPGTEQVFSLPPDGGEAPVSPEGPPPRAP